MDDRERRPEPFEGLEELMRAGLYAHADDVEIGDGYAETARRGAARRRRTRVGAVGVAAAIAVLVPIAVMSQGGDDRREVADDETVTRTSAAPASQVPANWRVESYDGVQLRVPPEWGWGGVPAQLRGQTFFCGDGAFAIPGHRRGDLTPEQARTTPYVGHAGYSLTDVCDAGPSWQPTQPLVWMGSPLDEGTREYDGGYLLESREVAGVMVTVGSADADERALIASTIQPVDEIGNDGGATDDNGCDAFVNEFPTSSGGDLDRIDEVESVSVCAYRQFEDGDVRLGYSTQLTSNQAQVVYERILDTPPGVLRCGSPNTLDAAVLRFEASGSVVDVRVMLGPCPQFDDGRSLRPLTVANVTPWLADGMSVYVTSGGGVEPVSELFAPIPG